MIARHHSVNRLALATFVIACLGSAVSFLYYFLFLDSSAWLVVYTICLAAWVFTTVFSASSVARGRVRSDEMSQSNEARSGSVAYRTAQVVLMVGVVLTVGFGLDITLNAPLLFGISFLLYTVQTGYYLFLEREGLKTDADTDD